MAVVPVMPVKTAPLVFALDLDIVRGLGGAFWEQGFEDIRQLLFLLQFLADAISVSRNQCRAQSRIYCRGQGWDSTCGRGIQAWAQRGNMSRRKRGCKRGGGGLEGWRHCWLGRGRCVRHWSKRDGW